jgi:hypothetical protein
MRFEKALEQGPLQPGPVAEWGRFTRYIEVGADGFAVRHIDAFECGQMLRYDRVHWVDAFGMLADAHIGRTVSRSRRWRILAIEALEFEAEWEKAGRFPQRQLQLDSAEMTRRGAVPIWLRPRGENGSPA